jgi:hypothetical protein
MDENQITILVNSILDQRLASFGVQLNTQVQGLFEVVSAVPAGTPSNVFDQIKIYINGGTKTLYLYDYINHAWRSVTLT